MILKGNLASLLLWLLLTAVSVLLTGWMHYLGNQAPSQQDARQITRVLQYELGQLQERLQWIAALPSDAIDAGLTRADVRLVVDRADIRLFQLAPALEQAREPLLVQLVNFLNQPVAVDFGVTYWRDKVLLVAVQEAPDEKRLAGVFLDEWLAQWVATTGIEARLESGARVESLRASGHALVPLPAIFGESVYVDAKPLLLSEAIPFRWWPALLVGACISALIVWSFSYRPVWQRVISLRQQVRKIMQSSSFRERVQLEGKDEIGDLAVLFNSLFSSLEYSHNLMAKTNMVSSELLAKMDSSAAHLAEPPVDEQDLKQTLDIASRLNEALVNGLIELYLQPVFGSDRKTITGYEAFSRWLDPELGMIMPPEYLAVAEKAGLVEPLTRLTLQQTLATLRRLNTGKQELRVSLNLSAAQFFAPGLMQSLYECDETDRALFRYLEVEVKESALTRNFDHASLLVERLRELGIGVCIDDYGLSRYSLMYLQKLPVTSIKLARVFSERISREPREVAFIEGVSRFAGGLGVRVIVKNIENEQQLLSLRADLPVYYQGLAMGGLVPADMA